MIKTSFVCNVCQELEENCNELVGLCNHDDDAPVFHRAKNDETLLHICTDCLGELRDFLDGGCK